MVVLTAKSTFPLLMLMPNPVMQLVWLEVAATVLANPVPPTSLSMLPLSSSVLEVTLILKCPFLIQDLVLNLLELTLLWFNP